MSSDSWVEVPSPSRLLFVPRCRSFVRRNSRRCCCYSRPTPRCSYCCCCCSGCRWHWCCRSDQPRTWPWARSCLRTGFEDEPGTPAFAASTRCCWPPHFRDWRSSRSTMKPSHCETANFHQHFPPSVCAIRVGENERTHDRSQKQSHFRTAMDTVYKQAEWFERDRGHFNPFLHSKRYSASQKYMNFECFRSRASKWNFTCKYQILRPEARLFIPRIQHQPFSLCEINSERNSDR